MKKFILKVKKATKDFFTNKSAFSLVELIVVIAIMAVMAAVLAPALLGYVEKSRMQKDSSAMDEVVNAMQLSLADQAIYDEVLEHSVWDNVSCYIDKKEESQFADCKVQLKAEHGDKKEQYMFGDKARLLDETVYYAAGNMRGLTITWSPSESGDTYDFANGILNKFVGRKTGLLSENPELYNRLRSVIGDKLDTTSQTYRNSDYTVFIRVGSTGGAEAVQQDAIQVWGQFNGTNLAEKDHKFELSSGRVVGLAGANDETRNEINNENPEMDFSQAFSDNSGMFAYKGGPRLKITVNGAQVDATWENLLAGNYIVVENGVLSKGTKGNELTGTFVVDYTVNKIKEGYYNDQNNFLANTTVKELVLENGITTLPRSAISNCSTLQHVYIPASLQTIERINFAHCPSLEAFIVDEKNQYFTALDGALYSKDLKVLYTYPNKCNPNYVAPNQLERVNESAFWHTDIKTITLSDSTLFIEQQAFDYCDNLTDLYVNGNCNLDAYAVFRGCVRLNIHLSNTSKYIFENGCLYSADKTNLKTITTANELETFTVLPTVTKISAAAFSSSHSKTIIIPKSLKNIDYYNYFYNLQTIKYAGTETEFNQIQITFGTADPTQERWNAATKIYNYN